MTVCLWSSGFGQQLFSDSHKLKDFLKLCLSALQPTFHLIPNYLTKSFESLLATFLQEIY